MTQQTSPFIEGKFGWGLGESGWNSGMDENLLKFSYLLDRNIDGVVATLPTATNGQAYFLSTDNRVYYSVNGFWYSSVVPKWFSFSVKSTGQEYLFTGTGVISQRSKVQINSDLDSLTTTAASLGTAAYKNVSDFSTSAYVDGKFTDLSNSSNASLGSNLVGFEGKTLYNALQQFKLPLKNIVYAEDPQYAGNIVTAAAAVTDNTTFIISQPYTVTEPLRFIGKTNVVVCCVGAGKLIGSRTAFTFPTANARGILHFDNCINPIAYRVNVLGARTAKSTFGADVNADGDAGIEYYQCTSPRTIECKVDQVLTWGVIHVGCTDTKVLDCVITNMTRQSGIGHATVVGGLCRGNFVNYSGLYGIEVEGPGNTDIRVHNNTVRNCLKGIAVIGSINSCEVKNNTISLCTYLVQLDANGASNTQVGVEVSGNRTYDGLMHYYLSDTTFVDVIGNTSLGRVANAYIPQRPEDQVVSVISPTEVLILNSATGTIAVGDTHFYSEGVLRTVQAVTTAVDPTYGSCWRITYTTANTTIGFGSFFLRNQSFVATGSWIYAGGTRNNNINVFGNSVNGPLGFGFNLNGTMNGLRWGSNRIVGTSTIYYAGDTTAITNSAITVKRGDIPTPGVAMFGGSATQKLFPSLNGEIRTVNMSTPNKPINLMTTGSAQAFRLRVNVYGSTKTANTGNAIITVNGAGVYTIPVATLGTTLIQVDIQLNIVASSFTLNIADTYGDMGFQSASFELSTIEV